MNSPYNTNRAVLESLLEDIGGGTEDINILRFVELGTYILEKNVPTSRFMQIVRDDDTVSYGVIGSDGVVGIISPPLFKVEICQINPVDGAENTFTIVPYKYSDEIIT